MFKKDENAYSEAQLFDGQTKNHLMSVRKSVEMFQSAGELSISSEAIDWSHASSFRSLGDGPAQIAIAINNHLQYQLTRKWALWDVREIQKCQKYQKSNRSRAFSGLYKDIKRPSKDFHASRSLCISGRPRRPKFPSASRHRRTNTLVT